jgi:two-component system, LytTR family, sensor kinase
MAFPERYLPYIISLLLPGISILSSNSTDIMSGWYPLLPRWLTISFFLFALWKLIELVLLIPAKPARWIALVFCPVIFIILFLLAEQYLFPSHMRLSDSVPLPVAGIKLFLGSVLYIAIITGFKTAHEREKLRVENISLQSENLETQLILLRRHVNPHFLFNSLSTLRGMIRSGDPQSEEFLLKLSDVYRQVLQNRESADISVKEELEFLDSYIFLLKIRYEEAITFAIQVSEESLKYSLPVFSIQLLVENCIKHNTASQSKPLHIRIYQTSPQNIIVANNIQPGKRKGESFGIGISNLERRYELMGLTDGIRIEQTESEYTATLSLF